MRRVRSFKPTIFDPPITQLQTMSVPTASFSMLNEIVAAKLAPVLRSLFCGIWTGIPGEPSVGKCKAWYASLRECISLPDEKLTTYSDFVSSQFSHFDWSLSELFRRFTVRNSSGISAASVDVDLVSIKRDLFAGIACIIANDSKLVRRSNLSKFTSEVAATLRNVFNSRIDLRLLHSIATAEPAQCTPQQSKLNDLVRNMEGADDTTVNGDIPDEDNDEFSGNGTTPDDDCESQFSMRTSR